MRAVPNSVNSLANSRSIASVSSACSIWVRTLSSGRLPSTSATAWRMAATTAAGSPAVRSSKVALPSIAAAIAARAHKRSAQSRRVAWCISHPWQARRSRLRRASSNLEGEPFADRVFVREKLPGEGFIDHHDFWRARVVLPRRPSGKERNLHRFQKVFAHMIDFALPARLDSAFRVWRCGQCATQIYAARTLNPRQQGDA